jgi:phenylpropionate dioxygenase-like ring-hydroxylating dioxygenase large terminal subunit
VDPAAEEPSGHVSVAHVRRAWYVLAESSELGSKPLARKLFGLPIVLFRDGEGVAGALLDRCPHRMVPLSLGAVEGGNLECGYHGWQFDRQGTCRKVPGLCSAEEAKSRDVPMYPTVEQDGFVWVWGTTDDEPVGAPHKLNTVDAPGYLVVRKSVSFPGSLHASLENALDVPHTAFLHRGLFRGGREPVEIDAVLTRTPDMVQAEFIGEPRPPGVAAKIMSPSGGVVTHYDRFKLPSIAEVEYRIGTESHIVTTSLMTPEDDFVTKVFAIVTLKTPVPGWLLRPFLEPYAMKIFRQDVWILGEQTEAIDRWGGERYQSTEIDLMGAQIWRMLRRAAAGKAEDPAADEGWKKTIKLRV